MLQWARKNLGPWSRPKFVWDSMWISGWYLEAKSFAYRLNIFMGILSPLMPLQKRFRPSARAPIRLGYDDEYRFRSYRLVERQKWRHSGRLLTSTTPPLSPSKMHWECWLDYGLALAEMGRCLKSACHFVSGLCLYVVRVGAVERSSKGVPILILGGANFTNSKWYSQRLTQIVATTVCYIVFEQATRRHTAKTVECLSS